MNDRELRERLQSMEWPSPSDGLRTRIAGTPVRPPAMTWTDRLWFSHAWRLGIAAAVLGLVALDYWVAATPRSARPSRVSNHAEEQALSELVRSTGLPHSAANALARRAVMSRTPAADRTALISGDGQ